MNNISKSIILLIFLTISPIAIYPQWTQTNGPNGGKIFSLAVNGNNIYAGTSGGIYVSTNNGINWKQSNNGIPTTSGIINAIVINGNEIYAGIGGGGVYVSSDNGASWTGINNGLPSTVYALAIDGDNIYAGIYGSGVYVTTDKGANWNEINNGLTNKYINALAVSGSNIFAGADLGGAPSGVFRSTDNGSNWSKVNDGLTDTAVSALIISGAYVIAGTATGTYRSTNNGTTWLANNNGLPAKTYVRSFVASNNQVFVGTDNDGVYCSTNNGSEWSAANNGLPVSNVWTLAINGTNIFAGTNGKGVYTSTDNGSNWNEWNNGIINTSVDAMVIKGDNIFAAAGNEGIFLSTNEGLNWLHANNGLPDTYIYTLALNGNNIFAGTRGSGVYTSADSGQSWQAVNTGLTTWNSENYISLASSGDNLLMGSYEGRIYFSNITNLSWNCIGDFGTARSINSMIMNYSCIFAAIGQGNGSGGVWQTSDYGVNWTELNNGLFSLNDVWDIAKSGNNILICVTGNGPGEEGIFKSSDYGLNWTEVKCNGLSMTGKGPFRVSDNKVFFGVSYYSTDSGETWNSISNNGLPGAIINTISLSGSKIYAGTNGEGIWSRYQSEILPVELSEISAAVRENSIVLNWKTATEINNHGFEVERTRSGGMPADLKWETLGFIPGAGSSNSTRTYSFTDKSINSNGKFLYRLKQSDNDGKIKYSKELEITINFMPHEYTLENNYPNPFNPSTTIKYLLPYDSNIKLIIYNTLGKVVKELMGEVQEAGLHEYKFNAEGISSGVYLYTIQAISVDGRENFKSTKKMVLMK